MPAASLFVVFFAVALAAVPLLYALPATTLAAVVVACLGHPPESIVLPFIGGTWSQVLTPTESAAVAVVYGVAVSLLFDRNITGALAWLITAEQVAEWIRIVASKPWQFLLLLNIVLLLLGIFIEPLPALLLTAPLFLPLAQIFKLDLVHLGVVMTANLAIALYTPPVGGTLFVAAKLAGAGIGEITRALWPLLAAAQVALAAINFVPAPTQLARRLLA